MAVVLLEASREAQHHVILRGTTYKITKNHGVLASQDKPVQVNANTQLLKYVTIYELPNIIRQFGPLVLLIGT
jgi:hypothetical protein